MTATSIRHMNLALVLQEQLAEDREKSLPAAKEPMHYWHIERKAKRGKRWIFVREYFGTKSNVADHWRKNYQGKKEFRLVHLLKYGA